MNAFPEHLNQCSYICSTCSFVVPLLCIYLGPNERIARGGVVSVVYVKTVYNYVKAFSLLASALYLLLGALHRLIPFDSGSDKIHPNRNTVLKIGNSYINIHIF